MTNADSPPWRWNIDEGLRVKSNKRFASRAEQRGGRASDGKTIKIAKEHILHCTPPARSAAVSNFQIERSCRGIAPNLIYLCEFTVPTHRLHLIRQNCRVEIFIHRARKMRGHFRGLVRRLWLISLLAALSPHEVYGYENHTLNGGWSTFPPYSYKENVRGFPEWKGLDVELLREISTRAGYAITSPEVDWAELIRGIKTGARDIAAQATRTAEREKFATFSSRPLRSQFAVGIRGNCAS
jgi:hypothetical protein